MYQIIGECTTTIRNTIKKIFKIKTDTFSFRFGKMLITFILVDLAWIFFRAPSLKVAIEYISNLLLKFDPWIISEGTLLTMGLDLMDWCILIISVLVLLLVDILQYKKGLRLDDALERENLWFRWLVLLSLIFAVLIFGEYGTKFNSGQFIYFQF